MTTVGAACKAQRKAVAPVFRHQNLLALAPAMIAAGEGAVARMAFSPGRRDVLPEMSTATLEIIAGTLLSGDEAGLDFAQITADVDILMEKIGRLDLLDFFRDCGDCRSLGHGRERRR
ncbi:MAG: hypothetical protein ACU0CI_02105 [Shimia sp.]